MTKKRYGKLVRDKIPQIIRDKGDIPNTRVMEKDEFRRELLYKLVEESEEARKALYYDDKLPLEEELADVLEVFYAIIEEFELDEAIIEKLRQKKLESNGGFENKIFLESVIMN